MFRAMCSPVHQVESPIQSWCVAVSQIDLNRPLIADEKKYTHDVICIYVFFFFLCVRMYVYIYIYIYICYSEFIGL